MSCEILLTLFTLRYFEIAYCELEQIEDYLYIVYMREREGGVGGIIQKFTGVQKDQV